MNKPHIGGREFRYIDGEDVSREKAPEGGDVFWTSMALLRIVDMRGPETCHSSCFVCD